MSLFHKHFNSHCEVTEMDYQQLTEQLRALNEINQSELSPQLLQAQDFSPQCQPLVQEINRETNTIGSKCQDIELARLVVDIKAEVEKIREQIQNIE